MIEVINSQLSRYYLRDHETVPAVKAMGKLLAPEHREKTGALLRHEVCFALGEINERAAVLKEELEQVIIFPISFYLIINSRTSLILLKKKLLDTKLSLLTLHAAMIWTLCKPLILKYFVLIIWIGENSTMMVPELLEKVLSSPLIWLITGLTNQYPTNVLFILQNCL